MLYVFFEVNNGLYICKCRTQTRVVPVCWAHLFFVWAKYPTYNRLNLVCPEMEIYFEVT